MTHVRTICVAAAAATLAACADTPTQVPSVEADFAVVGNGHRATGSGHLQTEAGLREFTFHALEQSDGSATGSYKVVLPNGLFFEADVTCLTVAGNTAWVGGVIRDSNAGIIQLGSTTMFYAIDNGEGGETDVVSRALINRGPGLDHEFCEEQNLLPDFEITVTDGNVQVR